MTDLPEIALAFARECMGWKNPVRASILGHRNHIIGSIVQRAFDPVFDYTDLNEVIGAVKEYAAKIGGTLILDWTFGKGMYVMLVWSGGRVNCFDNRVSCSDNDDCVALMSACLEAARKLNANASEAGDV